jgi:peptide chain release factor subunit 1
MATLVTNDILRELASFRSERGCALSMYVDLDPSRVPTIPDVRTKLRSLHDRAAKLAEERAADRDCRLALRETLRELEGWWDDGFERGGARGLAVFASAADSLFRVLPLSEAAGDAVEIGPALHLSPLAAAVERRTVLVAVVSRERGSVYRYAGGRLEEVVDETVEQPGQHDQGGWSQSRYRRHIDHLVHQHLKAVGGELGRRARRGGVRLVLVAPDELRSEIESTLSAEARDALVGWATAEAHAGASELLAAVGPVLAEARARDEQDAFERWEDEYGAGGRATGGWPETLDAASHGRVDTLLLEERASRPAWQCPRCDRPSASGGACPLDGQTLVERGDGADLAIHQTLLHGGEVVRLGAGALGDVDGIGSLTRF